MKHIFFTTSVFCIITLCACGENEGGGPRFEAAKPPSLPTLSTPASAPNNPILPGGNPTAPIIASAKLNPAHGQPGHRCDIAVGSPLPAGNSPIVATAPNTPALTAPAINTNPAIQQAATSVAAGLNPAHGQPGHRCDIPVGQPLNSKPQPNNSTAATAAPAPPAVVKPDTLFAKGLNPAHGQPGHRCDIAVGQPLKSAAKKS